MKRFFKAIDELSTTLPFSLQINNSSILYTWWSTCIHLHEGDPLVLVIIHLHNFVFVFTV